MIKRFALIDSIRGFAMINMILYHLLWDLVYIYDVEIKWYEGLLGNVWQMSICSTFIIISGMCTHMGKKKIKRALYVLGASLIVTIVTMVVTAQNMILCGILWFMGMAMLICTLLDKYLKKINPYIGIIVALVFFVIFKDVKYGGIWIGDLLVIKLPKCIYANLFTACIGFPNESFSSGDYFPVIPWIWLYLVGYYGYLLLDKRNKLKWFEFNKLKWLQYIGRHTLEIYMLHQVVIYAVLLLIYG